MRGQIETGLIKNVDEVQAYGEGYRGLIVIAGQGRWETPEAPSREAARILLDELRAKLLPKPKGDGISDAQRNDMQTALYSWSTQSEAQ